MLAAEKLRDFVIVNPGAGWGAKRWPAERYGQVALAISQQGIRSIINYGPGEELWQRRCELPATAPHSHGKFDQPTDRAHAPRKFFIGGDTGPMHLAAALRIPVVAILVRPILHATVPMEPGASCCAARRFHDTRA